MRREEAITTLRGFLPALRRDLGVRRIALLGSTAHDEAREDSDLDILVEFEGDPTFDSFFGVKFFLEDHLARRVDLDSRCAEAAHAPGRRARGHGCREGDWRLYADDIVQSCGRVRRFIAGMTCTARVP